MAIGSSLSKLFNTAGTSKPQTGTGYTNLNKFLGANQGNQLGQKVAGNLQSQVGGVKSQLGQQQTAFQTEAEKNKLDTEENKAKRDEIIGRFSSSSTQGTPLAEEDISKVSQYRGGAYSGPTGLQDTSALSQQAQDLAGQTSNLSPSGTQELLRRTIGGGRYTQGQQKLDTLLMDRSGLRQVGREAQSLGSDVNRANLAAQGQAKALAGQAAQFGQETTGKLQGALTGLDAEAMKQLESAQGVETARQAQLEQLQRTLQGNQVAKLDANGTPVLDENGNPVYETRLTGTTDPYARIDEISKLLKDQGLVNQNQYEALFGKGTFSENKSAYDKQLADIQKQRVLDTIAGTAAYAPGVFVGGGGGLGEQVFNRGYDRRGDQYLDQFAATEPIRNLSKQAQNYIASKGMDMTGASFNAALGELFKTGQITEAQLESINPGLSRYGGTFASPYGNLDPITGQRANALEGFKSATGLAGRSTLDSRQDDFYKNLAASLGQNSQAAQNLTKESVAAAPIRSNYAALSQLLGTPDINPYTGEPTYKAGTVGLDAAQIKRALGY